MIPYMENRFFLKKIQIKLKFQEMKIRKSTQPSSNQEVITLTHDKLQW